MKVEQTGSPERGVAAVNRALSVLEAFSRNEPAMSLATLASRTGLYKSTLLRLCESLTAFGYLIRDDEGIFRLGVAPLRLGSIYLANLQPESIVMPVLRELARRTLESAALYVEAGNARLCAFRVRSARAITDNVQQGELLPLEVGAGGLVILAFTGRVGERFDAIRESVLVMTRGQRDSETAAIACPVFGVGQKLEGALSLSGPMNRFSEESVKTMGKLLAMSARDLTSALGGDPQVFEKAGEPLRSV